jgi:hypothetical protein
VEELRPWIERRARALRQHDLERPVGVHGHADAPGAGRAADGVLHRPPDGTGPPGGRYSGAIQVMARIGVCWSSPDT